MAEDRKQGFLAAESETSFEMSLRPAGMRRQVLAFQTQASRGPPEPWTVRAPGRC